MKLPTKEQIAERANYLYGEICAKMMDDDVRLKKGYRRGAEWRRLIADQLTMLIYEHGGMLDKSSISWRYDEDNPEMGLIRVSVLSHRYDHDVVLPRVY